MVLQYMEDSVDDLVYIDLHSSQLFGVVVRGWHYWDCVSSPYCMWKLRRARDDEPQSVGKLDILSIVTIFLAPERHHCCSNAIVLIYNLLFFCGSCFIPKMHSYLGMVTFFNIQNSFPYHLSKNLLMSP